MKTNAIQKRLDAHRQKTLDEIKKGLEDLTGVGVQIKETQTVIAGRSIFVYQVSFTEPYLGSTIFILNGTLISLMAAWEGFKFGSLVGRQIQLKEECVVCSAHRFGEKITLEVGEADRIF